MAHVAAQGREHVGQTTLSASGCVRAAALPRAPARMTAMPAWFETLDWGILKRLP